MAINRDRDSGMSVYCNGQIDTRAGRPLYVAARELASRISKTKCVMDLGCGDLVASYGLEKIGFKIIGTDLDSSSLQSAKSHIENAQLFQSDLAHLPIGPNNQIDTVLLLDVLEHLNWKESVSLLAKLKEINPTIKIVVSMPNVSWVSVPCWKERINMWEKHERPAMGLFDRTHIILTDTNGHKRLFNEAGYGVLKEYYTSWDDGVSGNDWKTLTRPNVPTTSIRFQAYKRLTESVIPALVSPFSKKSRVEITSMLKAYQGLYIITPKPNS